MRREPWHLNHIKPEFLLFPYSSYLAHLRLPQPLNHDITTTRHFCFPLKGEVRALDNAALNLFSFGYTPVYIAGRGGEGERERVEMWTYGCESRIEKLIPIFRATNFFMHRS
jgi:hypothetical protein